LEDFMSHVNSVSLPRPRLRTLAAVSALLAAACAMPAFAAKDCGAYTVTIGNRTFTPGPTGDLRITLPGQRLRGQIANVRGKFTQFDVELDSFSIIDYTLTGAPAPHQITPGPTPVFVTKIPDAQLSGPMDMRLRASGELLMERDSAQSMKIQAKDCDQGGVFQLEPEPATTETNTLAEGFRYCFQASPTDRRFFTNDVVLGYDSPQTASTVFADETTAIWQVQDGGRIGGVFGEDAVQALAEAGPAAIAACPHQTPDL
jgi:hypothetical protein